MITPEQAIAGIHRRYGAHPGSRALHAKGTLCEGSFTATPEAGKLTRAAHMRGEPVEVIARVSNGAGDPGVPDYAPDVRGLAVSFRLADGARTDIVSQSAPRFPFATPEQFIRFVEASKPGLAALLRLAPLLLRHRAVLRALPANRDALKPPPSYAAIPYYAVHAFRWIDADGRAEHVRYTWEPEEAAERLSGEEARSRGRDYLREEIAARLATGSARFRLVLQIAEPGDPIDDPSTVWPDGRRRVVAGTLELAAMTAAGDELVFDPMRLTDGIEATADPVLRFRPRAYSLSHEARTGSGPQVSGTGEAGQPPREAI